jgi:hypothetical protein
MAGLLGKIKSTSVVKRTAGKTKLSKNAIAKNTCGFAASVGKKKFL